MRNLKLITDRRTSRQVYLAVVRRHRVNRTYRIHHSRIRIAILYEPISRNHVADHHTVVLKLKIVFKRPGVRKQSKIIRDYAEILSVLSCSKKISVGQRLYEQKRIVLEDGFELRCHARSVPDLCSGLRLLAKGHY